MLQYAQPNAPQPFQRRASVFADPPRPSSAASHPDTSSTHSSNGYAIARPPSTISVHSAHHPRQQSFSSGSRGAGGGGGGGGGSDISLATLASLAAASAPAPIVHEHKNTPHHSGASTRSSTPNSTAAMSQSQGQSAPAATAGYGNQNGSAPPICANCQTSTTPLWRRDESGSVLCNACGLFLKLHGRPRPISLKTDVIKSRNRVKASQAKKRDSQGADATALPHLGNGYSAGHAEVAHLQHAAPPGHQHSLPMGSAMHEQQHARAASPNPIARSQTPVLHQQHTNIAPQHIFDTVSLPSDTFASPSIPHFPLRQPSPSQANAQSSNGHHTSQSSTQQQQQQQQHQDVLAQNETLRTRVSELEVINDLFRGRVSELEHNEQEYRQRENAREEEAQRLTAALAAALARAADLQRVVDEMQQQHLSNGGDKAGAEEEQTAEEGPARKKARIGSDSGADSISKVDSVQGAAQ